MSNIKNSKLVHYDIHQCVIQNALHAKYAKHHPYQENINILAYFCFKKFPEPQHFPVQKIYQTDQEEYLFQYNNLSQIKDNIKKYVQNNLHETGINKIVFEKNIRLLHIGDKEKIQILKQMKNLKRMNPDPPTIQKVSEKIQIERKINIEDERQFYNNPKKISKLFLKPEKNIDKGRNKRKFFEKKINTIKKKNLTSRKKIKISEQKLTLGKQKQIKKMITMEEEYFNPNNVKKSENLENLYGLNKSSDRFSTKESNLQILIKNIQNEKKIKNGLMSPQKFGSSKKRRQNLSTEIESIKKNSSKEKIFFDVKTVQLK